MRYPALVLIATAGAIHAQQEVRVSAKPYTASAITLRVQSDLVEVGVAVRNHDGRAIPGLKKEDFKILDKGEPRDIASFAVETGTRGSTGPASSATTPGETLLPLTKGAARPPRFIVLYFEDFATNGNDLKRAQIAGRRFINEGLDDNDRVAVSASSGSVLDFTADKPKVIAAIDKIGAHPRFSENGHTICPRITPYQAYLIAVLLDPLALQSAMEEYKACTTTADDGSSAYGAGKGKVAALDQGTQMIKGQAEGTWTQARGVSQETLAAIANTLSTLASKPGRRLLLLVSSGFLSGTLERERDRVINQALHAGVVINALDAKGLYSEAPTRPVNEPEATGLLPEHTFIFEAISLGYRVATANEAMTDFAQSTGGLFFHNNNDLAYGFHLLGSLPDVSYVLGFHPGEFATDGRYHKLKVKLTASKPYVIEARPGYFALPKEPPGPLDRRQSLDREVMGDSTSAEFPASATYLPGGPGVKIQVHVDIRTLQFPKRGERRIQKLEFVVALLDAKGSLVAAKEGTMDFALTDATYARLSESGINAGLNLEAPPGVYRLREVVQEAVDGKLASSVQMIEVK